jgi:D-alanine-D-alanine ligase-like ATP-grasp enzyme
MPVRERSLDLALLSGLAGAGRPGRELAAGFDLLRSTGVRYAARRGRDSARARRLSAKSGEDYASLWSRAAHEVGAELIDLSDGFFELRRGSARARVWNHWVAIDDIVTMRLALEKTLVHRLLIAAGLPVPEHLRFEARDDAPALAFLARAGSECFVKPVNGAGGTGATGCVASPRQLRRAVLRARRRFRSLMIERQVPGDVYRLLFYDGELLDVIRRFPPSVSGDGRSTVRHLIAAENRRRFEAAAGKPWLLTVDLDCLFTLERRGLSLDSVPARGDRVAVKTAVNSNGPEDNESVLGEVSADLIAQSARAAAVVGVRLAGVDVITRDPMRSLEETGGAILEVNATPGVGYHYAVRNPGRTEPVAAQILRRLLAEPTSASRAPHAATQQREDDNGRQAQVGGDASGPWVPDPRHLGAAGPGNGDRSRDLRDAGRLGSDEPALHDGA